jgi:hypothetical protein
MRPETLAETLRELQQRRDEKQAAEQAFVAVLSDMRILAVQDAYLRGYDDRQPEIDALQAELAAARQEFAEWLDASRKALAAHAEVVTDRDRLAACVERVRNLPTWDTLDFEAGTEPVHAVLRDTERNGAYVKSDDILAALEEA